MKLEYDMKPYDDLSTITDGDLSNKYDMKNHMIYQP